MDIRAEKGKIISRITDLNNRYSMFNKSVKELTIDYIFGNNDLNKGKTIYQYIKNKKYGDNALSLENVMYDLKHELMSKDIKRLNAIEQFIIEDIDNN